ncbi:hypothetical protein [Stenotrophomonas sp. Marseille-Q4652]|uniref:hypothetical protein n=1 Tax=Stenotrophomonas sp. Marseille-Q4652 TaxID=2866595 RepID=UPI001CE3F08F|nr:hypothetical protein [Stenotrophomonas sp. Marseille-Q4652]
MLPDNNIESLYSDLEALRVAVETEDYELAEQLMHSHDRHLREYVHSQGVRAPLPALQGLLKLQQALMADMLVRRDIAAARLRAGRQSIRAARAYHQAESLA